VWLHCIINTVREMWDTVLQHDTTGILTPYVAASVRMLPASSPGDKGPTSYSPQEYHREPASSCCVIDTVQKPQPRSMGWALCHTTPPSDFAHRVRCFHSGGSRYDGRNSQPTLARMPSVQGQTAVPFVRFFSSTWDLLHSLPCRRDATCLLLSTLLPSERITSLGIYTFDVTFSPLGDFLTIIYRRSHDALGSS
jgi:hypothetical protein